MCLSLVFGLLWINRDDVYLHSYIQVLSPLGMSVTEKDESRGEWAVRKGTWSQPFQDGMKISAFAKRMWPAIRLSLTQLPKEINEQTPVYSSSSSSSSPSPLGSSILGKRPGEYGRSSFSSCAFISDGEGRSIQIHSTNQAHPSISLSLSLLTVLFPQLMLPRFYPC